MWKAKQTEAETGPEAVKHCLAIIRSEGCVILGKFVARFEAPDKSEHDSVEVLKNESDRAVVLAQLA